MIRPFLLLSITALLCACGGNQQEDAVDENFAFERLAGKWEDVDEKNKWYEEWNLIEEGLLEGRGYVLYETDTVFIECMYINFRSETPTYSVGLSGGNSEESVVFDLTSITKDQVTFENPNGENLKKISYKMISNVDMRIYIDEMENGAFGEKRFSFLRVE
ncbi:MAG: DUF6265 family protein [Flavobacteriales bacterium]|nr:DUF6265 family protein [Flavobacteriales bacterium]MDG1781183.1 DUF6265 family protein [Flavobacteriales bacterium]MDG2246948.1 DUF6265 family protein [Flavobacteriales bacterium]